MNLHDLALDIIRDVSGQQPDAYVTFDGLTYWDKAQADQHQRTLFINHHDRLAQQAQTRATQGAHP